MEQLVYDSANNDGKIPGGRTERLDALSLIGERNIRALCDIRRKRGWLSYPLGFFEAIHKRTPRTPLSGACNKTFSNLSWRCLTFFYAPRSKRGICNSLYEASLSN